MAAVELKRVEELSYRECAPQGEVVGTAVLVHGFPQSSRMWVGLMEGLAAAGWRSLAPDLYCLGDSADPGPATFERNRDSLGQLLEELTSGGVALVVHDWGGFVGLAWACEHPERVRALVISSTGFFADGRWHGIAEAIRKPGGEQLVEALDRDGFAGLLRADGAAFSDEDLDAYWAPFKREDGRGREATVEFYRSMDFEKLAPYQGKLGALGVPALLIWGSEDRFAPLSGARRFEREIPETRLLALEGCGHFPFEAEPETTRAAVSDFLAEA
jgi:haloalkane dehalogenase